MSKEDRNKAYREYIMELTRKNELVKSDAYLDWLSLFMAGKTLLSDDDYVYDSTGISPQDKEYVSLLGHFYSYIEKLSNEQYVFPKEGEDSDFDTYPFKLRGEYFEIITICGQGAFTTITKVEYNENDDYIYVDEEIPPEVLKSHELVQYILVNKDLIDKISPAKIAVHVGHACTIAAIEESNYPKFEKWYQEGSLQKKIILKAPLKKLEEVEKWGYAVRDLGYTEVEEGTLIAVSLGVMSRSEAAPYIKRLQAW